MATPLAGKRETFSLGGLDARQHEQFEHLLALWAQSPVHFVIQALGGTPDPWQCDVLDALMEEDNVAVRACHGVGKTALVSWACLHYLLMRPYSEVITTAPTYVKQVKDVIWKEIFRWWREAEKKSPWLTQDWKFTTTRLEHVKYRDWFAVGIASNPPINMEGYHAPYLMGIFDEAKGIKKPTWDAVHGMRTTQQAKLLVTSTPGGPSGEFFNVFTKYRQTWKRLFVIHPEALRTTLKRPEATGVNPVTRKPVVGAYARGGTYYSTRVRPELIDERLKEWGRDSPVFIARMIGDFPTIAGDVLIPYTLISDAVDREEGSTGPLWVGCDVARYGADRTVALVMRGGTALYGETIARSPAESTAPEVEQYGDGGDARRPLYRSEVVTAEFCRRLMVEWGAEGVVVDDTGLGGGVTDILRHMGVKVVPISFGVPPTDRPRTAELVKIKKMRNQPESLFMNIKAQMAWALRSGFEDGFVSLHALPQELQDPLVAQLSRVKTRLNDQGRLRVVDPDEGEDDDWSSILGDEERHRSPDHFHALLLAWWMCGTAHGLQAPKSRAIIPGTIRTIGNRRVSPAEKSGTPNPVAAAMAGVVGGAGKYLGGLYRPGRR